MKKLILIILIMLSCSLVYAKEQSMTQYKDNYFISDNSDIKMQISVKYNLIYPFNIGIYFAYTEMAWWKIFESSSPFKEFNHNPEVFWQSDKYGIMDYIKISPFEHKSNGRDGSYSRSVNKYYIETQISYGNHYNFGSKIKVWGYYNKSRRNSDIDEYSGYFEGELFLKIMSKTTDSLEKEKLYVRGGCESEISKGWIEAGLITRILTSKIQPRLFIQGFYGYGESMVDYNVKEERIRFGIIF